ncbi:YDG domain-containing protein [Massilia sp. METH4]|uniref:YDG domain-containing protein n=1 Tax=Massilia sp. METH4 TaxID=3123041 RepID=UPI0030D0D4A5
MKQPIDSIAAGGRPAGLARRAIATAVAAAFGTAAWAQLPTGGAVAHGSAVIATDGARMTVTNSPGTVLDWQSFSVGARNGVHFAQQSAASQVLNRVVGNDPSAILGTLSSNGGVWLVNPHGVLFGSNARIDVAGLVATTLPISNDDFRAGRFRFDGAGLPGGQVLNQGEIHTSFGGRVWLMGDSVRNEGLIHSPGGQIVLAAGKSIELVDSGMPNVTVRITAPENEAVNLGTLLAPGSGRIDVHGGIVNQQGIVRADSIGTDPAGRIVMKAQGDVRLAAGSMTSASAAGAGSGGKVLAESVDGATLVQGDVAATSAAGSGGSIHLLGKHVGVHGAAQVDVSGATGADDILVGGDYQGSNPAVRNAEASYLGPDAALRANATARGDGGKVILWGDRATRAFGTLEAHGGPGGGDGGLVETSGRYLDARPKGIDVRSHGGKAGTWLLDPGDITIGNCCSPGGYEFDDSLDITFTSFRDDSYILVEQIRNWLQQQNNVVVRTGGGDNTTQQGNITVESSIEVSADGHGMGLTLEAHNDIILGPNVRIGSSSVPMPVTLTADRDGNNGGRIVLNPGSGIATLGGEIRLTAANLGNRTGDGIRLDNATLDARGGPVGLEANRVDIVGNSSVTGGDVGILADAVTVDRSTLLATEGSIGIRSRGLEAAGIVSLNTASLDAGFGREEVEAIDIAAVQLDMTDTSARATGNVRLDAGNMTLQGVDIGAGGGIALRATTAEGEGRAALGNVLLSNTSDGELPATGISITGDALDARNSRLASDADINLSAPTIEMRDVQLSGLSILGTAEHIALVGAEMGASSDIRLTAPLIDIALSDFGADTIVLTADKMEVATTELGTRFGSMVLRARTDARDGSAILRNVRLRPVYEQGVLGVMSINADTIDATDLDVDSYGDVFFSGYSTSISNPSNQTQVLANRVVIGSRTTRLDHAKLTGTGPFDALYIGTESLENTGSQLSTPAGRWLVYFGPSQTTFPAAALAGLDYTFVQYNVPEDTAARFDGVPGAHGVLMTAPLDLQFRVDASRQYDGTTRAAFTNAVSHNAPTGFTATAPEGNPVALGEFDNKNVGTGKPVRYLGEADYFEVRAPNGARVYDATHSYVADITAKQITLSGLLAQDKVYDTTPAATLTGTLAGIVEGDDVTLAGAVGQFSDENAGSDKTVTITGGTLAGADKDNYAIIGGGIATADIFPLAISASGITAADKVYDGTRIAALSGSLSEVLSGDDVSLTGATGQFDDKNVGTGKAVSVAGGNLTGADAANYVLEGGTTTRATIAPRPVTIAIAGQVAREYDATTAASLGAGQFVLDGVIQGDAVSVGGPVQGNFDTPNVGQGKTVTATGVFQITGADAFNYRVGDINLTSASNTITATATGAVGTITPATLFYTATPAQRDAGTPIDGLTGTVTGFKGADTLASATTGVLVWQTSSTSASPGLYPVIGSGLSALNYVLVQAPGNEVALQLTPGNAPAAPPQRARESSVAAIASAVQTALPAMDPPRIGSGVLDMSGPGAGRTYGAVNIGGMSQNELARMIEQRRDFKRKLFADAIYKLELDPSLADVRACTTVLEAGTGACRIPPNQLERMTPDTRLAALAALGAKVETSGGSADPSAALAPAKRAATAHVPQIERKIAVLFGINEYADKTIPRLENALPDVDAVSALLADKLGYEVRVVRNPSKADIIRTLNALQVEINSTDSVVIYYAGHGFSLEKNGTGYWLPADAASSDPSRWISNNDVAKLLSGIRSSQMVLISDSCYSGAFARDGMDAVGRDVTPEGVLSKRSVVVISSGGDEPVADEGKAGHSIFAWNLMEAMRSVSAWKPGSTLFNDVQAGVKKEFPQTPKYGSVTAAGHQAGGDYLFELR